MVHFVGCVAAVSGVSSGRGYGTHQDESQILKVMSERSSYDLD
jgi:hypothetical protein